VTFDDLWKGGMTGAFPVLKCLGIRALAFVVRGWVFEAPQVLRPGSPVTLCWAERDALTDVFSYANHTDQLHTRGPAGPALLAVGDADFAADLARCEERTTLKGVFAYPFGAVGPRSPVVLAREGYSLAFTTEPGANDRGTDPLRLKRNLVPPGIGLDAFAKILQS
jgi:peptidoglycan/xylan/chitin deacetylase (PgdA/CDA1 family)